MKKGELLRLISRFVSIHWNEYLGVYNGQCQCFLMCITFSLNKTNLDGHVYLTAKIGYRVDSGEVLGMEACARSEQWYWG